MIKAIFLDRDGTLIEEVNFLSKAEDTKLFPFTVEALQILKKAGFKFFVTTNQSGIARGYFGKFAVDSVHGKIQDELKPYGVEIESFHFCPHMPDDGCACRKPRDGMIQEVILNNVINLEESWTIGDKRLDIEAGFLAGTRSALVLTGYGIEHKALLKQQPDIIADNILDAAKAIVDFQS